MTPKQFEALIITKIGTASDAKFWMVAEQIAKSEVNKGVKGAADRLDLVLKGRDSAPSPSSSLTILPRHNNNALDAVSPTISFDDLILDDKIRHQIDRVVEEHRRREDLLSLGFSPSNKVMLVGPPGTGKTMTAEAVARALEMPLFIVKISAVVNSYLGDTAKKIDEIFQSLRSIHGVYFFDEFDALGSQRGADTQSASREMDRAVTSMLIALNREKIGSIVIAATNTEDRLDDALRERFDKVIRYQLPERMQAIETMKRRCKAMDTTNVRWEELGTRLLSHRSLVRSCEDVAKDAIMSGHREIRHADLQTALDRRRGGPAPGPTGYDPP